MAHEATTYHRGEMNIHEQEATFKLVMQMTKWGSLSIGVLLLFLTLWFCAGVGFVGALATAVVVLALGVIFLRDRGEAH